MATFTETEISKLVIIQPENIFYDYRGQFFEIYNKEHYETTFKKLFDINVQFVTEDISISRKNVLRGLHGDFETWKLVECLNGEVFVVVVDLRQDNEYNYLTFNLNDKNKTQLLIPPGCVNGYLCISEQCIFHYHQSEYYSPDKKQISIKWDSIEDVHYPIKNPIISERDEMAINIFEYLQLKNNKKTTE